MMICRVLKRIKQSCKAKCDMMIKMAINWLVISFTPQINYSPMDILLHYKIMTNTEDQTIVKLSCTSRGSSAK